VLDNSNSITSYQSFPFVHNVIRGQDLAQMLFS